MRTRTVNAAPRPVGAPATDNQLAVQYAAQCGDATWPRDVRTYRTPRPAPPEPEENSMPLPRRLAQLNRRVFNPGEIRRGVRPVLIHVGRSTGRTYRTPLDAHPVPGGYVFIPRYGPRTDWVRNVLAAGAARLSIQGVESDLVSPRMVRKQDVWPLPASDAKAPPGIPERSELLRMDCRQDD